MRNRSSVSDRTLGNPLVWLSTIRAVIVAISIVGAQIGVVRIFGERFRQIALERLVEIDETVVYQQ